MVKLKFIVNCLYWFAVVTKESGHGDGRYVQLKSTYLARILYSLIVSCQRHGKDPLAYLRDILTRLPRVTNQDDLRQLTPARWQPPSA